MTQLCLEREAEKGVRVCMSRDAGAWEEKGQREGEDLATPRKDSNAQLRTRLHKD